MALVNVYSMTSLQCRLSNQSNLCFLESKQIDKSILVMSKGLVALMKEVLVLLNKVTLQVEKH